MASPSSMGKGRGGNCVVGISSCVEGGCSNSSVDSRGSESMVGNSNGLVDSNMVLVNDRGLNNLLDGVNLVGLRNSIGLGNLNGVGFGNVFLNNDLSLDGDRDSNGDLNSVFVNLKLWFDTGHFGGDDGVGPDRCLDFGDGDSISRGRSLVSGGRGDGSIRGRGSRNDRGCNGHSVLSGLCRFSNISVSRGLVDLRMLGVCESSLYSLGTNLDSFVSDNLVCSVGYWGSSMNVFLDRGAHNSCGISYSSMGKGGSNSMDSGCSDSSMCQVGSGCWGSKTSSVNMRGCLANGHQ